MVLAAGFHYYNVLSVIFAKQCCIIHPVKEYLMLYNVCIYSYSILKCDLRVQIGKFMKMHGGDHYIFRHFCLFFSYICHIVTQNVKQQVISCSTTLVYHSHIEKFDLGVEQLNKLNSWRPFWKISCNLFS